MYNLKFHAFVMFVVFTDLAFHIVISDAKFHIKQNSSFGSTVFICYFSPCSGSHTDEPEDLTFLRTPLLNEQDQKTFDAQLRQSSPKPPSLDDLDVTPEKEGKTTMHLIVKVDSIQIFITQNIN